MNELNGAFVDGQLNYDYARLTRMQFQEVLLPAMTFVLENFRPYKDYIDHIRKLERDCRSEGDIGSYALAVLRFGTSLAPDPIKGAVDSKFREIVGDVDVIKRACIIQLLREDIGMRGVISAFGTLFRAIKPQEGWLVYAKWFTAAVNQAYEEKWLSLDVRQTRRHLHQIVIDHNDATINYRLQDADDALGAYVVLLVWIYSDDVEEWNVDWDEIWDNAVTGLRRTLLRGYKKEARLELKEKEEFRDGGKPLTEAVNKEAAKRVSRHVKRLEKALRE